MLLQGIVTLVLFAGVFSMCMYKNLLPLTK